MSGKKGIIRKKFLKASTYWITTVCQGIYISFVNFFIVLQSDMLYKFGNWVMK